MPSMPQTDHVAFNLKLGAIEAALKAATPAVTSKGGHLHFDHAWRMLTDVQMIYGETSEATRDATVAAPKLRDAVVSLGHFDATKGAMDTALKRFNEAIAMLLPYVDGRDVKPSA